MAQVKSMKMSREHSVNMREHYSAPLAKVVFSDFSTMKLLFSPLLCFLERSHYAQPTLKDLGAVFQFFEVIESA